MKYSDLIYGMRFPEVLRDDEFNYYFNRFKEGDMNARNILIERNIRLVVLVIRNKFLGSVYEMEELFEIGIVGLIKAIDSFDIGKNKKISTYATKCIQNEILMYIRKNKKNIDILSLDTPVITDGDNSITFGELLEDDSVDLEHSMIKMELERNFVILVFSVLNDREKKVMMMYYGFINEKIYNHEEIARELNVHRTMVTKIIAGSLKKIKKEILFNSKCLELVKCLGVEDGEIEKIYSKIRG